MNMDVMGSSRPNSLRIWEIRRAASSESPPISKNPAVALISFTSIRSNSDQISASLVSAAVTGAIYSLAPRILPVSGKTVSGDNVSLDIVS
jgi:hypothetical protein